MVVHSSSSGSGNDFLVRKDTEKPFQNCSQSSISISIAPCYYRNGNQPQRTFEGSTSSSRGDYAVRPSNKPISIFPQKLAVAMLQRLGAEVTAVGDGLQAADLFLRHYAQNGNGTAAAEMPFTCVLMDCQVCNPPFADYLKAAASKLALSSPMKTENKNRMGVGLLDAFREDGAVGASMASFQAILLVS